MSSEAVRKRVARSVEKFRRVYGKQGPPVRAHPYTNALKVTPKGMN